MLLLFFFCFFFILRSKIDCAPIFDANATNSNGCDFIISLACTKGDWLKLPVRLGFELEVEACVTCILVDMKNVFDLSRTITNLLTTIPLLSSLENDTPVTTVRTHSQLQAAIYLPLGLVNDFFLVHFQNSKRPRRTRWPTHAVCQAALYGRVSRNESTVFLCCIAGISRVENDCCYDFIELRATDKFNITPGCECA